MSELVTAVELADRLRLRPTTIRLWTREGLIPAIRISGKVVRYDPEEVEQALRKRSAERAAEASTCAECETTT